MPVYLVRCMAIIAVVAIPVMAMSAEKCPKGDAPIDSEDVRAAHGCLAAHKLHAACAWGSSGDAFLSEPVLDKCEAGFLPHLTAAQKRIYEARRARCSDRYPTDQNLGTIQIYKFSMCAEDLAATYFKAAAKGRLRQTPRWRVPHISD